MFKFGLGIFTTVLMDEASSDGAAGGGAAPAAAPAAAPESAPTSIQTEETKAPEAPKEEPKAGEEGDQEAPQETHPMDAYIEMHSDKPALSLALGFLRDNGISPTDEAFTLAEVDGDFTVLEAILASKGINGSDKMLDILKGEVAQYQEAVAAKDSETLGIITDTLGEDHGPIFEWTRENASPEELRTVNEMFACGGIAAKAAAMVLQNLYQEAGNTVVAKSFTSSNAGGSEALSREEFTKAVSKVAMNNPDYRSSPAYQNLWQRRQAGMKRGI